MKVLDILWIFYFFLNKSLFVCCCCLLLDCLLLINFFLNFFLVDFHSKLQIFHDSPYIEDTWLSSKSHQHGIRSWLQKRCCGNSDFILKLIVFFYGFSSKSIKKNERIIPSTVCDDYIIHCSLSEFRLECWGMNWVFKAYF